MVHAGHHRHPAGVQRAGKQAEGFVKAKVLGKEEVLAVHPSLYAGRFVAFLEKHIVYMAVCAQSS